MRYYALYNYVLCQSVKNNMFTLEQVMKAQRGVNLRIYSLCNFGFKEVDGHTTPRPIYTEKRDTEPMVREAGWTSGSVWMGAKKKSLHRDSIPGPSSLRRVAIPTTISRLFSKFSKYVL